PAPQAPATPIAFPSAAERDARRASRTGRLDWVLRIAAVFAIVAAGGWTWNVQRQADAATRFERAVASVIQAGAQTGAKTVILKPGKDTTANGLAAIAPDGSVVLAMRDLAPTQASQVYEAWVIVGQTDPVPVGGFRVGGDGTAAFTTRPAATPLGATIALTLEPNEGNPAPTGPIVSSGVAAGPPGSAGLDGRHAIGADRRGPIRT
ncbi:MAG: anti-sigma factor, partial [Chloroflexi bacterium]|nr:anti-sigma factor [Chloroflexota bacterium]